MKAILLEDVDIKVNSHLYRKGQKIEVSELKYVENSYAIYHNDMLDWMPKSSVRIIE